MPRLFPGVVYSLEPTSTILELNISCNRSILITQYLSLNLLQGNYSYYFLSLITARAHISTNTLWKGKGSKRYVSKHLNPVLPCEIDYNRHFLFLKPIHSKPQNFINSQ